LKEFFMNSVYHLGYNIVVVVVVVVVVIVVTTIFPGLIICGHSTLYVPTPGCVRACVLIYSVCVFFGDIDGFFGGACIMHIIYSKQKFKQTKGDASLFPNLFTRISLEESPFSWESYPWVVTEFFMNFCYAWVSVVGHSTYAHLVRACVHR